MGVSKQSVQAAVFSIGQMVLMTPFCKLDDSRHSDVRL